ncbi:MAG: hypothetical protein ACI9BW_000892 [Gammaproteobacteria bacterium]
MIRNRLNERCEKKEPDLTSLDSNKPALGSGNVTAITAFVSEHRRLPRNAQELGTNPKAPYPDGGYFELEQNGIIRIRFTVKRELKNGSIIYTPRVNDESVQWDCVTDGDIVQKYVPRDCRN